MKTWRNGSVPLPLLDLARNLWAACHLLCFRRSALRWLVPTPANFLLLLALSLTVSFCFDFLSEGRPGEWSPAGVAVYALPAFVLLIFGQILATRHGLWRLGLAPASIWLAADSLLGLAQCVVQYGNQHNLLSPQLNEHLALLYTVLYAWPILAVVFVFTRALAWPWWERSFAFVILLSVFTAWILAFSDERLWYATVEPEAQVLPDSRLTEEAVFYAQPELLQRALDSLQPQRPDQVDWYFLGVAGAAYQGVFRSEVETARALFDTRFATTGRSLLLINNDDTAASQPLASRTSIVRSLQAMAGRMDREHDVLFLFVSSHGSEDGLIELSNWPLDLPGISPEWLRTVLDESGIRHRVIVLSACYSGRYLATLASPDTLLITASDATHTSFGCSDDADLTYFGRAFFDEALRHAPSLEAAFAQAKQKIGEREKREGYEASNPQWQAGGQMQQELPALEKSLFPKAP